MSTKQICLSRLNAKFCGIRNLLDKQQATRLATQYPAISSVIAKKWHYSKCFANRELFPPERAKSIAQVWALLLRYRPRNPLHNMSEAFYYSAGLAHTVGETTKRNPRPRLNSPVQTHFTCTIKRVIGGYYKRRSVRTSRCSFFFSSRSGSKLDRGEERRGSGGGGGGGWGLIL